MVAFGLVTVVVTGLVSILAFRLASTYMIHQRERSAVAQTVLNARLVAQAASEDSGDLHALLTGLTSDVESATLLIADGQVISSSNIVDAKELPGPFLAMVEGGQAARQRLILSGVPVLAVGVPMPSADGEQASTFIQVSPVRELDRTLRYISTILAIGVALSAVAGALLGRWAAARAMRPLTRLTAAASAAASGDLSTRLPQDDPDLATLAAAFNETAERLQARVSRDARFAGDVSHELRSPLMTMANAVAILERRRAELSPSAARALDLIATDVARFQQMVEDLLEISSAADDAPQRDVEVLDLVEFAQRTTALLQLRAPVIGPAAGEVLVSADRRRLERALVNLLDNGQRHGAGVIEIRVRAQGACAYLEVDDAGPGVRPADREAIFGRFARAAAGGAAADRSGSGLGLSLVAEHVRRHDGRAWVEDRPGGGARFVIELPRVDL